MENEDTSLSISCDTLFLFEPFCTIGKKILRNDLCNMERWIRIYRILYSTVYNRKEWRKERCVNIFFASCLKKKKVESFNFVSTIDNVERTPRYQSVVILSLSLTINFNLADFTTRRNGRHANFIWESRAVPFETACSRAGSQQSGLTDRFNSQGS